MPLSTSPAFATVDDALADLRRGKMVVLTDDESRENEGDLVLPAQFATPEAITFMLQNALGYLCLSLTEQTCDRLGLSPQVPVNTTARGTAFTISIDGHPKHGFTTGVSARERARCVQMAIDPAFGPDDFVRPGHINPLRSRDGGVLVRTGQTEGSVDLCRLAGLHPAALIIEIMRPDGEMARVPDLIPFCERHDLKMCSVAQIIEHRLARESLVRRVGPPGGRPVRTPFGPFTAYAFESLVDPLPHVALTLGDVGLAGAKGGTARDERPTLVRMHRRHLLGDVFGDLDSGHAGGATGDTLRAAMAAIQREGRGAIVYLRTVDPAADPETDFEARLDLPSGRDAGGTHAHPHAPPRRTSTPDDPDLLGATGPGARGAPMTHRDLGVGVQILRDLGLSKLRLLTNSHVALPGLEAFGLEVVERIPIGGKG